jgi:hypothetical protein
MDAPEDANILASERQGPIGLVVCQAGPPGVGVRPVQSAAERSTLRCRGRPAIHSPTPRSDIVPARFVHEVLRHGFEASKTLGNVAGSVSPDNYTLSAGESGRHVGGPSSSRQTDCCSSTSHAP